MTDLKESLIVIGGTVVIGVFLYNKWQEYKAKKTVERAFSSTHDDVLMNPDNATKSNHAVDAGRHEPSFDSDNEPESSVATAHDDIPAEQATSPAVADVANGADTSAEQVNTKVNASPRIELPIDSVIDCAIPVALAAKVSGEKILQAVQSLRHVGNKPVHFIGLREDQTWEVIRQGSAYFAMHAGVQLANRTSTLNEIEYSELVSRLRHLSDQIDAEPQVPDMTVVMKNARALHQFINQFDAKLSVNVQSNGAPWAISTLLAALERQGFDVRPDGRLVMPDGDGGILFTLSTNVTLAADTTSRLTLLLDVPCVAPQREGYNAMISFAKSLATRLGGTVVDDSNQPLSDTVLSEIALQVGAFCRDMETAGVAAGSTRALRLFS